MTQLTILTICNEPLLTVLRFVAWHREMGAERIVLYFDDPEDPAIAHLKDLAFVKIIRCTPQFWRKLGVMPDYGFVGRQTAAMTHGYRQVQEGWVGVLDADELFYDADGRLADWLTRLPYGMKVVRLKVAEAVSFRDQARSYHYARHFRIPIAGRDLSPLYGPYWRLISPGAGTVGHFRGKSLARAGLNLSAFRQHWPEDEAGLEIRGPHISLETGRALLHFFEAGWEQWRRKIEWRLTSGSIAKPLADHLLAQKQSLEGQGGDALDQLWAETYSVLHVFDEERLKLLRSLGGLYTPRRDVLAPARKLFGAPLIDGLSGTIGQDKKL